MLSSLFILALSPLPIPFPIFGFTKDKDLFLITYLSSYSRGKYASPLGLVVSALAGLGSEGWCGNPRSHGHLCGLPTVPHRSLTAGP